METIKKVFFIFLIFIFLISSYVAASNKTKTNLSFKKNISIPTYEDYEILNFEKKLEIKLPKLLKNIYTKQVTIENLIFSNNKNRSACIETIFKLEVPNNLSLSIENLILLCIEDKYFVKSPDGCIAFAIDEFGDLAYMNQNSDILVYHHESDDFLKFSLLPPD